MAPEYFYPLLGFAFAFGFGVLGTIRWYVRERFRVMAGQQAGGDGEQVRRLEARVAELEERVDFAERLLARGREEDRGHA